MKVHKCYYTYAFLACALLSACTPNSSDSGKKITLRSLDGASLADTLEVNENLPLMAQQKDALYRIRGQEGTGDMGQIYIDNVISSEYKIIPLETMEDCVIGNIDDILKDDSLLFVVDTWSERICVFNLNGKFLRNIGKKGHAADEYVSMTRVAFDKDHKRMGILDDDSQKLLFYDYNGNFLGKESLYFRYEHLAFCGDDRRVLLVLPYEHDGYEALNSFKLTLTDKEGVPVCGVLKNPGFPKHRLDNIPFNVVLEQPLHANPDGVYYVDILSPDTIWRVSEDECVPFLAADFGEPFTDAKSYGEMTKKSYQEKMNTKNYLHDDFIFTKDFGCLSTTLQNRVFVNLKTGQYQMGRLSRRPRSLVNDFSTFAFDCYTYTKMFLYDWEANQIARIWPVDEVLMRMKSLRADEEGEAIYQSWPQEERAMLEHLSPEDNPVIVVATLKEF